MQPFDFRSLSFFQHRSTSIEKYPVQKEANGVESKGQNYSYSQHLTLRPFLLNTGGSWSHFSKRNGQRAAKRQPVGKLIRLGG